ncbi:30S ribosomal protein S15 [Candidatus Curculioniphilus buchneri]|uniref:30S ribosomal protein S15 n=1 Tax=Candidatus Curculioniphilus buchneri TaxID=690594 RepID=UPI00376ECBA3
MSFCLEKRKEIISNFGRISKDSGKTEVQIAFLSYQIDFLQNHFSKHRKDHHSRRGLLRMVSRRRKLLDYLKDKDIVRYSNLIVRLGLRH